jgi:hypothetical protein
MPVGNGRSAQSGAPNRRMSELMISMRWSFLFLVVFVDVVWVVDVVRVEFVCHEG